MDRHRPRQAAAGDAWASALVNATFARMVARRGSRAAAASILDEAERAMATVTV